ncbi:hypothetical protein K7X08_036428 [Anisodus acutangulus]|uniref:DUF4378 domain-containing protein n=1 Tax=Anisodus acutangulus TaxID=402998 RepID=A0A9Q1L8W3_9SOLA|nr:hypothetical protein K7X08_036428 [Anisodus acutangulus]
MEVEKRSSKGGFLQLFDWNIKSRKKLFSNKSELPENSKQGKENANGSANLRLQQAREYDPGSNSIQNYDFYSASSVAEDGSYAQKAPSVVARLMGLDSLPTSKESDPYFNSSFDCHSFRDSPYLSSVADFQNEHHMIVDVNMRNKLDGFKRNPVEMRLQKVQSRPIERFQSEVLPPKSAKPVSVTQHRLLSPIKSPGFIPPKNAAYIIEAAAKIYEQSPRPATREKVQSSGSSSVPLRIRDLRDRMEAAQRQSRIYEASHRPKEQNSVKNVRRQPFERGQVQSDNMRQFRASEVSRRDVSQKKGKEKSVSLAVQAKTNVQKREGKASTASKNPLSQKELNESKSGRKRLAKVGERRNSLNRPSDVLKQNNQKQNSASNKDGESSKTSAPYHKEKKVSSTGNMSRPSKTVSKIVVNTTTATRTASIVGNGVGKDLSSSRDSRLRSFTGKKQPGNGDIGSDGCGADNMMKSKDERSIKCNLTIKGCSNWDTADRKKESDVVSFTFTSPIKKSTPGLTSSRHILEKNNALSLFPGSYDDQSDSRTSTISSLGSNAVGGDDLGMLLEQKLRELTSKVGPSCEDLIKTGTPSISANTFEDSLSIVTHGKRLQVDLLHEKADDYGHSSVGDLRLNATQMWQGPKKVEKPKNGSSFTCEREFSLLCSSPASSLEPSISGGSCNSLDSYKSLATDGSKYHLFDGSQEMMNWKTCMRTHLVEGDAELLDSASSVSLADAGGKDSTITSTSTIFDELPYWEFRYIRDIIKSSDLELEEFILGEAQSIIALDLFDQLENQKTRTNKNVEEQLKIRRRVLFDSVVECLEFRCKQSSGGSFEAWEKWTTLVQRKEWLAEEVYRDIAGWTSMEELMVDEVVDKDMSTQHGKWTDFSFEAFEEGVDIEKGIISSLMDELIHDLM